MGLTKLCNGHNVQPEKSLWDGHSTETVLNTRVHSCPGRGTEKLLLDHSMTPK